MMKNENQVPDNGNIEQLVDVFPWRERRVECMRLCDIYECAAEMMPKQDVEYRAYAHRTATCGAWLQFSEIGHGTPDYKRSLRNANFCHLRLCPMCTARRARRAAAKLGQILAHAKREDADLQFIFLTLTVPNCQGDQLGQWLTWLTDAWKRLIDHRAFKRAIRGWFRAIEITVNHETQEWHPHIHAILAVPSEYFDPKSGLYIDQKEHEWTAHWLQALGLEPTDTVIVHVEGVYKRRRSRRRKRVGEHEASMDATQEAAKYATKPEDYIDQDMDITYAAWLVHWYTQGLRRKRLTAFGGILKAIAKQYDAANLDDGDLVHADQDRIADEIAETIAIYGWHLGVGDYILMRRERANVEHQRDEYGISMYDAGDTEAWEMEG